MNEEMRKEFEEWALHNCYILDVDENGDYEKDITFSACEAWKASRESMKPIKLPDKYSYPDDETQYYNNAIDECIELIKQAGYKAEE